jgi:phosphoserine phosphatase
MTKPRFASVVLGVDSTVSGIEGIDWLARRRGSDIAANIARLTADAMRGAIPLENVYGRRLALIEPTRAEIDALSQAYIAALAPDCPETIAALQKAGVAIALVSQARAHAPGARRRRWPHRSRNASSGRLVRRVYRIRHA